MDVNLIGVIFSGVQGGSVDFGGVRGESVGFAGAGGAGTDEERRRGSRRGSIDGSMRCFVFIDTGEEGALSIG
jgi:hypothetical protein